MKREEMNLDNNAVDSVVKIFADRVTAENICVSYETAKALHEAGIVVDSLYGWFFTSAIYSIPVLKYSDDNLSNWYSYPAPTAEELWVYCQNALMLISLT